MLRLHVVPTSQDVEITELNRHSALHEVTEKRYTWIKIKEGLLKHRRSKKREIETKSFHISFSSRRCDYL